MKIIRNSIIPFGNFTAINLFGIMFVKESATVSARLINHESIHSAQMREMLYVPFYITYFIEWILRLLLSGNPMKAYRTISFEKEAYKNDHNPRYLSQRKSFAQWRT